VIETVGIPQNVHWVVDYFGGAGGEVKISRLRPGSGFGFGLGAFFASFLPLSLLPMHASMTQKAVPEKSRSGSGSILRPRFGAPKYLAPIPE